MSEQLLRGLASNKQACQYKQSSTDRQEGLQLPLGMVTRALFQRRRLIGTVQQEVRWDSLMLDQAASDET